jgi:hypothetical protein
MPCLAGVDARWDKLASRVRYYGLFEGSDDAVEISPEDFERLSRLFTQEAIDTICEAVTDTLERANAAIGEFATLRKTMQELYERAVAANATPVPAGTDT